MQRARPGEKMSRQPIIHLYQKAFILVPLVKNFVDLAAFTSKNGILNPAAARNKIQILF